MLGEAMREAGPRRRERDAAARIGCDGLTRVLRPWTFAFTRCCLQLLTRPIWTKERIRLAGQRIQVDAGRRARRDQFVGLRRFDDPIVDGARGRTPSSISSG